MCGRFVLFTESLLDEVGNLPGIQEVHAPQGTPGPRYNIAPTQPIPIVREELAEVDPARWALLPQWKKDLDGPPVFNARAETVASKPSFRTAFRSQRCLIPMNGYYEWHKDGSTKTPYYVHPDQGLLWAAGLWDTGLDRLSATIVTTAATEAMEWLHHRLPRFLASEEMRTWLEGSADEAKELLVPTSLRGFEYHAVDKAVGTVSNDYPELLSQ